MAALGRQGALAVLRQPAWRNAGQAGSGAAEALPLDAPTTKALRALQQKARAQPGWRQISTHRALALQVVRQVASQVASQAA